MLTGTASIDAVAARSPVMESLFSEELHLPGVEILQVLYELGLEARQEVLLPGLHPTNPPYITWQFFGCSDSPIGAFHLAQLRIGCRSGTRPRGFLFKGFIDNETSGKELTRRFGYSLQTADVVLDRGYHATSAHVTLDGRPILEIGLTGPQPLSPSDVQYSNSLHPANTPMGFRLVQIEPQYTVHRAERGTPRVRLFDAAAWGDSRIRPSYPVSASITTTDIDLPKIRFVCRADVLAFEGTEQVHQPQPA